ncbi:lipoprotein 17-related variable surface protein, partial [Mycoplasmopsis primatum]|uniref:lipoprotein 17-related variable surface protein n=1 Tax=Mycoplasmopsis primatum TaxID=55604 RepID=UPI00056981CB
NGIKNISFKLKYDHKESSKVANLSINKFYSTKQFDALCDSLTIEDLKINVDSDLSPSEYNVGNIQLKKDSPLLSINANLIISQTEIVLTDDQNGDLDIKVILADKINKCSYSKNLKITGFYSILKHNKQVEDFANSLSIDSFVLKNIRHYRASNYSVEEIEFKEEYNQKFIELIKKVDFKYTLEPKVSDGQEEVFIRLFFTAKNKKFSVEKIIGPYGGFYKTGDAYSLDSSDLAIILRRIFAYSHYVLHEDKIDPILKDISLNKYFLFNHGKITKSEIEQRLNLALHDQEFMQALIMNNQAGIHQAKRATKLVSWISRLPKLRVKIISWSDSSDYEQFVKFIFQLANSTVGNPDFDYDNSSTKYQFNTRKSGLTRVSVVRTKE